MIEPKLPTADDLKPSLEKLEANPGSVVLIAVELAESHCNFARCSWGWFSGQERKALRRALETARRKRQKAAEKGLQPFSE